MAFDSVEPIGEQWLQSAQVCELLSQLIGVIAATNGVKLDSYTAADFMPGRYERPKEPKKTKKQKQNNATAQFHALAAQLKLTKVVTHG